MSELGWGNISYSLSVVVKEVDDLNIRNNCMQQIDDFGGSIAASFYFILSANDYYFDLLHLFG